MKSIKRTLLYIFIIFIFFFATAPATAAHWIKKDNTISIGAITKNPVKEYSSLKAFSEYLAASMKDLGIVRGRVVPAPTLEDGLKLVKEGMIDIIPETAYSSYILMKKTRMIPILVGFRNGEREYSSFIVVNKDSHIRKITDLVNKKIIFKNRHATVTYIIPRIYMESKGLKLFFAPFVMYPHQILPEGYTAYDFICNQKDSIQAVLDGTADACAIRSTFWEKSDNIPKSIKKQLRILKKTVPVPRSFILCSSALTEDRKERIISVLTESRDIPLIYKTRQYERLDPQDIKYFENLRMLLD